MPVTTVKPLRIQMFGLIGRLSNLQFKARPYVWRAALAALLIISTLVEAMSTPLVSDALIESLQTDPVLNADRLRTVAEGAPTAIVVLSAGRRVYAPEYGRQTVDGLTLERIRYAAELARETHLPLLASGGLGSVSEPDLAHLMSDSLTHDFGIKTRWLESRSTNTAENAIFSSAILKAAGIARVILVTHAWHMRRAKTAFERNGLTVVPAPTAFYGHSPGTTLQKLFPGAGSLRTSGYALHEILGFQWYALKYGY